MPENTNIHNPHVDQPSIVFFNRSLFLLFDEKMLIYPLDDPGSGTMPFLDFFIIESFPEWVE